MAVKHSLEGKFALLVGGVCVAATGLATLTAYVVGAGWLSLLFSLVLILPTAVYAVRVFVDPMRRTIQAVADGISSMKDNDFSVSLAQTRADELAELVAGFNGLGGVLRTERQDLYQRELLLDTVVQATPTAMVLVNSKDQVVFGNAAARHMFCAGRRMEGNEFARLLDNMPFAFQQSVARRRDGLFTVDTEGDTETYHLAQGRFTLNAQPHRLYLFRQMTKELSRQEVAIWKKVIRVIAHEINNSLAPMSSLAHSGKVVAGQPDPEKLEAIFSTIEERARYLQSFIDGYARFAKLPSPRVETVRWEEFLETLHQIVPFETIGPTPSKPARFDPAQIQQVLINLLKNAAEAGSDVADIGLETRIEADSLIIRVLDRGSGMSDQVLKSALLPFYSTKQKGTGLGLPLCREIVEAHGGRLSLANRGDGGLVVEIRLPLERAGTRGEKLRSA